MLWVHNAGTCSVDSLTLLGFACLFLASFMCWCLQSEAHYNESTVAVQLNEMQ